MLFNVQLIQNNFHLTFQFIGDLHVSLVLKMLVQYFFNMFHLFSWCLIGIWAFEL